MGFLLKVKRAKFVLDETRKWMWKVLIHMIVVFFFLLSSHSILHCEFSFDGVEEIMDCYVAGT